jgi:O-antigen/teichoic acid export membrane protein
MPSVKANTLANLVGTFSNALIYFIVLPMYLHTLGAEAFGVIGLFFTLTSVCAALDLGVGAALNRELAKRSIGNSYSSSVAVVKSFERLSWLIGGVLAVSLLLLLPLLVDNWLQIDKLDKLKLREALYWMAIALAVQPIISVYTNALWGLQSQVAFNVINSIALALRLLGAAYAAYWTNADLVVFFACHGILSLLHACSLGIFSHSRLPVDHKISADWRQLKDSRKFIADLAMASLLATLLTHLDKLLLSKLLSLREFGYYMMAWSIASIIGRLASSVYTAWLPRLTQHVTAADAHKLRSTYYSGFRVLLILTLPVAMILMLLSFWVLETYTRDSVLASSAWLPLTLLAAGSFFNGLSFMPYALALAHGWTRVILFQNAVTCVLMAPLVSFLAWNGGIKSVGAGWLLVNVSLFLWMLFLMNRYCLTIPRKAWS